MSPPERKGGIDFEQGALAVEHTDAGRAEHLVPAECIEVGVERLNVDRKVRHALRAVDYDERSCGCARGMIFSSGMMVPRVLLTCAIESNYAAVEQPIEIVEDEHRRARRSE